MTSAPRGDRGAPRETELVGNVSASVTRTRDTTPRRIDWSAVLQHAAGIVDQYTTPVTLRQLYYRLVADGTLPKRKPTCASWVGGDADG